jgi:hypothetical protein
VGFLAWMIARPLPAQTPADAAAPAAPPFAIELERDDFALGCPDLAWFQTRIASHIVQPAQAGSFKITLARQNDAWLGRIERREPGNSASVQERVLQDRSSACEPLAEAVAVTVAILADAVAAHVDPPLARAPDVPVGRAPTEPPKEAARARGWLGAAGGAALSFISPDAATFGPSGGVDYAHLRVGARLMMTTEQKFDLDPGRVFVQAWFTTLYGCLQGSRGRLGAAACVAADGVVLRATTQGFDQGRPGIRGDGAIGWEVHPSLELADGIRLSAVLGALLPFSRESFSVTGRGVAYVPPRVNLRILLVSEIGVF